MRSTRGDECRLIAVQSTEVGNGYPHDRKMRHAIHGRRGIEEYKSTLAGKAASINTAFGVCFIGVFGDFRCVVRQVAARRRFAVYFRRAGMGENLVQQVAVRTAAQRVHKGTSLWAYNPRQKK